MTLRVFVATEGAIVQGAVWVAGVRRVPRVRIGLLLLLLVAVGLPDAGGAVAAPAGMWLSAAEIAALPTSGAAFEHARKVANEPLPTGSNLARRDSHNVQTLAAALVGVRLGDAALQAKAVEGLRTVVRAAPSDDLLAASRRLGTYVIAADVLDLARRDPNLHEQLRTWAGRELTRRYPSGSGNAGTIVEVHERRPNNWGTHAGASRIAVAIYRGDGAELQAAARVFRAWLGDRTAHQGFSFGALDWQADRSAPVGINPRGARIDGRNVDGVLPDDQRRAGGFTWPPQRENYVWEALQGATVQAQLLHRQGHDAWGWQDRALVRALTWLHEQAVYPAEGDDSWVPHLVNHATGSRFLTVASRPGKNMGFTDWTHAGTARAPVTSPPPPTSPTSPTPTSPSPPAPAPTTPAPTAPSSPAPAPPAVSPTHAAAVEAVLAAGIAEGFADGSFHPERPVTRGQMATFLARALGLAGRDPGVFPDSAGHAHGGAIAAVAKAGIARGFADGGFHPERPVTRAQMATFLARALDLEGRSGRSFPDTAGNTHARSIEAVAAAGIAEGYADGTFRPGSPVNRGQMASFLARAFDLL